MKKGVFFSCVLAVLSSCGHPEAGLQAVLDSFGETVELSGPEVVDGDFFPKSYGLVNSGSNVFSYSSSGGSEQIGVLDLNTGRRQSFLKKGHGPQESTHVNALQVSEDSLFAYVDPEKIYSYHVDSDGTVSEVCSSSEDCGMRLCNGRSLSFRKNCSDSLNTTMYCSKDGPSAEALYFEKFPFRDDKIPFEDNSLQTAWQGKLVVSPDGKKSCFMFYYALGFDVIDSETLAVSHHLWTSPQVYMKRVDALKINLVRKIDGAETFEDCCVTDNFIYISCRKSDVDYLLKFTWDGAPVTKYVLDSKLEVICVDRDERLYAVREEPEADELVCYALK